MRFDRRHPLRCPSHNATCLAVSNRSYAWLHSYLYAVCVQLTLPPEAEVWRECQWTDGRTYYHSLVSDKTQWTLPKGKIIPRGEASPAASAAPSPSKPERQSTQPTSTPAATGTLTCCRPPYAL